MQLSAAGKISSDPKWTSLSTHPQNFIKWNAQPAQNKAFYDQYFKNLAIRHSFYGKTLNLLKIPLSYYRQRHSSPIFNGRIHILFTHSLIWDTLFPSPRRSLNQYFWTFAFLDTKNIFVCSGRTFFLGANSGSYCLSAIW